MKSTRVLAVVLLVVLLASSASAFDGMRKGFVLGGGLGFAPVANTSIDGLEGKYEKQGLGVNFLIGYAWDERNMIVFLRDGAIYSETIELTWGDVVFRDKINMAQGFSGVGYYHYFGPVGKAFFVTAGIGFQDWMSLEEDWENPDLGAGLLFGGGYEFTRHVQVYSSVSFGKTSDAFFDYNHAQWIITVSAVAF
ncbi:MAG: hypothetical protein JSV52_00265 [Candidatus Zixiibacteriota bacterium]|nr:MAG: hypothetical protein JSV52_00265 [candidate division Zixibacteria bacterium]